jgi:hypothetical protein
VYQVSLPRDEALSREGSQFAIVRVGLGGVGHCFAWQATRPFLGNGCGSCIANCYTIALLNSQTIHDKGNHQFIWIGLKPTFCMSIFLKVRLKYSYHSLVWFYCIVLKRHDSGSENLSAFVLSTLSNILNNFVIFLCMLPTF